MKQISVARGIAIKVNDQGDTISMNVDDQRFIDKFYGLIETFDKSTAVIRGKQNAGEREKLKNLISETEKIMAGIDDIFGKDACKKIFGDIVPSPVLIADFFDQMIPITRNYTNERQKMIEQKYSRSRKGGRR